MWQYGHDPMTTFASALSGLRVLDVSQVMAGPFCAMILADLGADVVKIEPPGGDSTRQMPSAAGPGGLRDPGTPAGPGGDDTPSFAAVNRGKRSAVVNLKTPEGRAIVARLADRSDILVENYRPGVMAGLGLDYETLAARNPALIYASISGYGQTGPDRGKGGFDLIAQGVSGIMSITGEPGRPPVKSGVPLTDLGAGLFALVGILASLEHRHHSGVGQHVDLSLVDTGVALSLWEAAQYFSGGGVPAPMGSAHRMNAPYQAIRCSDGYITVGAANERLFKRLSVALGHEEWIDRPAFSDNPTRVRNHAALAARIESITADRPCAHWLALLNAHDVPCGPINDYAQVFADPQVLSRGMVAEVDHPTLGRVKTVGSPIKLSATPPDAHRRAPLLGEHTADVLREAGYGEADTRSLRESAVVDWRSVT
jgi:crotonobetainyl-CoA:carnitine CoA-transferase CaiB-like acyl-CoA transferase